MFYKKFICVRALFAPIAERRRQMTAVTFSHPRRKRKAAAATKRPASIEAGLLCRFQRRGYFFFLSALAACAAASASMGAQPPPKALKS